MIAMGYYERGLIAPLKLRGSELLRETQVRQWHDIFSYGNTGGESYGYARTIAYGEEAPKGFHIGEKFLQNIYQFCIWMVKFASDRPLISRRIVL